VVHYENAEDVVENNKQNSLNLKKRKDIQSKIFNLLIYLLFES